MKTKPPKFSSLTFDYFKRAKKNQNSKEWFLKNKAHYETHVREPFQAVILELQKQLQRDLPRIVIDPRSVTRPVRPANRASSGLVKTTCYLSLWEKKTSLFEWNPGVHFQIGAEEDDNLIALGLYMVSSRQMSLMRQAIFEDFDTFNDLLMDKKFKKTWGSLEGEKFVRYPKGFPVDQAYSGLLMHKQFFVSKRISKKELYSPGFSKQLAKDLKLAMPFFNYIRQTVGTYQR
jgi:uncharacterized protein (TIGR02453 family)